MIADDGSPIDRIHVEVSAPVGLFLSFVEDGGATLFEAGKTVDLTPGQVRHIDTRAVDAQGGTLIASNSIVWTLPDTNV